MVTFYGRASRGLEIQPVVVQCLAGDLATGAFSVGGLLGTAWSPPHVESTYKLTDLGEKVTTHGRVPGRLEIQLREAEQLAEGWDGYGAHPITSKAIETARNILSRADSWNVLPFVSPTRDGGVGMEWPLDGGKELLLEVSRDAEISFLLVVSGPDGEEEKEGALCGNRELNECLREAGIQS
jgi:hypothetical protein